MQITPVYDRTVLTMEGGPPIVPAVVRQRRRLLGVFSALEDDQWVAPSRCADWSVRDVAVHLATVDRYWAASINAGLVGEPTRFIQNFDPKATPAAMVRAAGEKTSTAALVEMHETTTALCDLIGRLSDRELDMVAESPPGHVSVRDVLSHALWDAWVHERDVTLPLDLVPAAEPDEIALALRYAAALSPVFAVMSNAAKEATLILEATAPDVRVVVTVTGDSVHVSDGGGAPDAVVLRGSAVELTEMLSARFPVRGDVPADRLWLVRSLADVFEV